MMIWMNTADVGDMSRWTSYSGLAVSTDTARTGSKSFRGDGNGHWAQRAVAARADYYLKVAVRASNPTIKPLVHFREDTTIHVKVDFNHANSTITAYNNTTAITGASAAALSGTNIWDLIEIYCKVHDSTGEVTVKVNGVQAFTATSKDTRNGATGVIDNIRFTFGDYANYGYFDDIEIRDDTWPGAGGILVFVPSGDGDDTAWTASAGTRKDCVNEQPPDFTDYITTDVSTTGTHQTFVHAGMSGTFSSIPAVCVAAIGKLDGAGTGNIRCIADSSDTYSDGASTALSTTAAWVDNYMLVDPNGSAAWDKTRVDALKFGVETI